MPEIKTYSDWVEAVEKLSELATVTDVGRRDDALDVVLVRGVDRVPPSVCRCLWALDLGVQDVHREVGRLRVVVA